MGQDGPRKTKPKSFVLAKKGNVRKSQRFATSDRVEYLVDGKRNVSFLANLSMGGMRLRGATGLGPGVETEFRLMLEGSTEPITLSGKVLPSPGSGAREGARIIFVPSQHQHEKRLRAYIEANVVGRLEKACARAHPRVQDVNELAAFYTEFGRHDASVELYTKVIETNPRNVELYESYARSVVTRAEEQGEAGWPAMLALEEPLRAALSIGKSELLQTIVADIAELRKDVEEKAEQQRREQEERRIEARVQQVLEARLDELRTEQAGVLADLHGQLDQAHTELAAARERTAAAEAEAESQRLLVAQERQERQTLGARLESQDGRLAKHVAWAVETQTRVLQAEHESSVNKLKDELESVKAGLGLNDALVAQLRGTVEEQTRELEARARLLAEQRAELDRMQGLFAETQKTWTAELEGARAALESRERDSAAELAQLNSTRSYLEKVRREQQAELDELNTLVEAQRREKAEIKEVAEKLADRIAENDRRAAELTQRENQAKERDAGLDEKERTLAEKAQHVEALEAETNNRLAELNVRARQIDETAARFDREARAVAQQSQELAEREAQLNETSASLVARSVDLQRHTQELREHEERLKEREQQLAAREQSADAQIEAAGRQRKELQGLQSQLDEREQNLQATERAIQDERWQVAERQVADKRLELDALERTLAEREQQLAAREQGADAQIEAAGRQRQELQELQSRLDEREQNLDATERAVQDDRWQVAERQIADKRLELDAFERTLAEREQRWALDMADQERRSAELTALQDRLAAQRGDVEAGFAALARDQEAFAARAEDARRLAQEQDALAAERQALSKTTQDVASLRAELEQARQQQEQAGAREQALQQEIHDVRAQLAAVSTKPALSDTQAVRAVLTAAAGALLGRINRKRALAISAAVVGGLVFAVVLWPVSPPVPPVPAAPPVSPKDIEPALLAKPLASPVVAMPPAAKPSVTSQARTPNVMPQAPATRGSAPAPTPAVKVAPTAVPASKETSSAAPARARNEEIAFLSGVAKKLLEQHNYSRAAQVSREILNLDPANATAYRFLGVAYSYLGSRDLACESYRRYLRFAVSPSDRSQVEEILRSCAPAR